MLLVVKRRPESLASITSLPCYLQNKTNIKEFKPKSVHEFHQTFLLKKNTRPFDNGARRSRMRMCGHVTGQVYGGVAPTSAQSLSRSPDLAKLNPNCHMIYSKYL